MAGAGALHGPRQQRRAGHGAAAHPGRRERARGGRAVDDRRLLERQPDGSWLARDEPHFGFATAVGFRVLSEDELRNLRAPTTTPALPPGNTRSPPLPIDRPDSSTPGLEAAPPAAGTPGLEAAPPLTAQDLIIEQRNSEILGDNLRARGIQPPDAPDGGPTTYEPHHIVPSRAGGERMDAIRDKLIGLDVNLNGADNGVWLPSARSPDGAGGAHHPRLNNDTYNDAVSQELRGVTTRVQAISVLADIAARLRTGDFPGVRPRP
jgi:A nuclease family of the HNH/ENDO VII superfamily with conserved AHH